MRTEDDPRSDPEAPVSPAELAYGSFLALAESSTEASFDKWVAGRPELAAELRSMHDRYRDVQVLLERLETSSEGARGRVDFGDGSQLAGSVDAPRYIVRREIARGGMGTVFEVWDREFRRALAMKVLRFEPSGDELAQRALFERRRSRALNEAQVLGQLDHPSIVPVHDMGLDESGNVFFTMQLVRGDEFSKVVRAVHASESNGWTLPRAIAVLHRVCEAVAYAHERGVVHRDLKPANVMVKPRGETYVMDWGLARIGGASEEFAGALQTVRTDAGPLDSLIRTHEGDALGTPAYMSPEQAAGRQDEVDARSDVYGAGAMLYHLLSGAAPYADLVVTGEWQRSMLQGKPPTPIAGLAPSAPAELCSICERAMARAPGARYQTMVELAEDLSNWLEGRVVRAHATGAFTELSKWMRRNRSLTAAIVAAVVFALAGVGVAAWVQARLAREVLRLADAKQLNDLEFEAERLWPARPEKLGDLTDWIQRAEVLAARLPEHRESIAKLRAEAARLDAGQRRETESHPLTPEWNRRREVLATLEGRAETWKTASYESVPQQSRDEVAAKIDWLRARIGFLQAEIEESRAYRFENYEDEWRHDSLSELVTSLALFAEADDGALGQVRDRWEQARSLGEESVGGEGPAALWAQAIASIADRKECPLYRGLQISPQMGLLPLGRDDHSGLWEFLHVPTGTAPERDELGRMVPTGEMGIVLVLLPGGTFWMGAQATDEDARNYDPHAPLGESPVHQVQLDPFFLSKYEMTQGQWARFEGENPSSWFAITRNFPNNTSTYASPVETVSWRRCRDVLSRLGLDLPTEAQWEYGARGGDDTPWPSGLERFSLRGAANLADKWAQDQGSPRYWVFESWLNDGWVQPAPVGSFRANHYGLHDMAGNVEELCRDYFASYEQPTEPGTGLRQGVTVGSVVVRGGGFSTPAVSARSAVRVFLQPDESDAAMGLRAMRKLEVD